MDSNGDLTRFIQPGIDNLGKPSLAIWISHKYLAPHMPYGLLVMLTHTQISRTYTLADFYYPTHNADLAHCHPSFWPIPWTHLHHYLQRCHIVGVSLSTSHRLGILMTGILGIVCIARKFQGHYLTIPSNNYKQYDHFWQTSHVTHRASSGTTTPCLNFTMCQDHISVLVPAYHFLDVWGPFQLAFFQLCQRWLPPWFILSHMVPNSRYFFNFTLFATVWLASMQTENPHESSNNLFFRRASSTLTAWCDDRQHASSSNAPISLLTQYSH